MNAKKNKSKVWLLGLILLLLIVPLTILLVKRMEGTPPKMNLQMASSALGASQTLSIDVSDSNNGLRQVWVALFKDGKETVLLDKLFPSANILMGGAIREQLIEVPIEPKALGIKDGKAMLRMVARDYSWRKWGKGNQQYQEVEVMIDTRAPQIEVISPYLNIAQGGAGIVIYRLSEECPRSGVSVGEAFYPGYSGDFKEPLTRMAFIALGHKQGRETQISINATDYAGNQGQVGVPCHIIAKKFKRDTIALGDHFLSWKMPEFSSQVSAPPGAPLLDIFIKVNRDLRRQNYEAIIKATAESEAKMLWKGDFLRLPRSANRAGYADDRNYTYKGKNIDRQTHLGIDLASLQNSPVPAANSGKVVYADPIGIYGNTLIIDHGFGLFSLYAHLSSMGASPGQMVAKGEIIGKTGTTGLAGGDHLHFSMLVHHTFVNPIEWWDNKWIKNNILTKLASVK